MLQKIFKLKEKNTTPRVEIMAGFTTFMTMAYIVALNPNLLTDFGRQGQALWNGVFMATCISSAIAMFCMAFLANKPLAMAPGMGLNSFYAVVVTNVVAMTGMPYLQAYQSVLVVILFAGILFLVLSLLPLRDKIVKAIPLGVRLGIPPAIGMMLLNIGLGSNAGVVGQDGNLYYALRDFFAALTPGVIRTQMGDRAFSELVLTIAAMFVGFFAIALLERRKFRFSVLGGMGLASAMYWAGEWLILKTNPFASLAGTSFLPPVKDLVDTTLFRFNFQGFLQIGWGTAVTLVITFTILVLFDTIGTLMGTAAQAGMLDEKGSMPKMREALASDAIGVIAGACTGTSTIATFVESAAGVEAGGRTGLTALTTGLLFLACIFIAPIASLIPAAATSAALIYVGILMLQGLKNVDFSDQDQLIPAALMLLGMPITGSVGHAIGIGLICYSVLMLFSGRGKQVSWLTYGMSVLFLVKFFASI